MRHRPITYSFEDPSGGPFRHVCGINDISPSFRPGHILTAGRDSKLLEWKVPSSTCSNSNESYQTVSVDHASSHFRLHADWVNKVLPIPNVGFVTAGADHAIYVSTVKRKSSSSSSSSPSRTTTIGSSASASGGLEVMMNNDNTSSTPESHSSHHSHHHSSHSNKNNKLSEYVIKEYDPFFHHEGPVRSLAWLSDESSSSPNYDSVIACSADNSVSCFGLTEGAPFLHVHLKMMPVSLCSNNNSCFFVGCMNGLVLNIDVREKLIPHEMIEDAHSSLIRDMLWYPSDNMLVTGSSDGLIRTWDVRHVMDPIMTIDSHSDAVWRLQKSTLPGWFHGDDQLTTTTIDDFSTPCSSSSPARVRKFSSGDNGTSGSRADSGGSGSNNSNQQCFLSAGRDGTLQIHDIKQMKTSLLAQCSHPIVSFHNAGTKVHVGTTATDVFTFDFSSTPTDSKNPATYVPPATAFNSGILNSVSQQPSISDYYFQSTASSPEKQKQAQQQQQQQPTNYYLTPSTSTTTTSSTSTGLTTLLGFNSPIPTPSQFNQTQKEKIGLVAPLVEPTSSTGGTGQNNSNNNNNNSNSNDSTNYLSPFKTLPTYYEKYLKENSSWASPDIALLETVRPETVPKPISVCKGGICFIKLSTFPTRLHVAVLHSDGNVCVYDIVDCEKVLTFSKKLIKNFAEDVSNLLESKSGMCSSWFSACCNSGGLTVTLTETEGNSSFLNGWELLQISHSYMTSLVADIEKKCKLKQQQQSASTTSSAASSASSSTKNSPSSNSSSSNTTTKISLPNSIVSHSLAELGLLQKIRHVAVWGFKRILHAAKKGRISRFIVKMLPDHHQTTTDKRSCYELPVNDFINSDILEKEKKNKTEKKSEEEEENDDNSSARSTKKVAVTSSSASSSSQQENAADENENENETSWIDNLPPGDEQPPRTGGTPKWLTLWSSKPDLGEPNNNITTRFYCDPHPNPLIGKKLPNAFADKKPPLTLPKTALLSDLAYIIVKTLKKKDFTLPSFTNVQTARRDAKLPQIFSRIETDEKSAATAMLASCNAEEYVLFFLSDGTILDPFLTMGVVDSIYRGKESAVKIYYGSIV